MVKSYSELENENKRLKLKINVLIEKYEELNKQIEQIPTQTQHSFAVAEMLSVLSDKRVLENEIPYKYKNPNSIEFMKIEKSLLSDIINEVIPNRKIEEVIQFYVDIGIIKKHDTGKWTMNAKRDGCNIQVVMIRRSAIAAAVEELCND